MRRKEDFMKILVTGGAGFIGSHTCVSLLAAGYEVVIADNFCNAKPETVEKIERIAGKKVTLYPIDLCDRAALGQLFAEQQIGAVIHFAGLKAVGESVAKPLEYYENNLQSTLVLCDCMQKAGVTRMVFSSSATVYGMENSVPFKEGMPTSATNPYGYTKVMIEQILTDIAKADPSWSVMLLRYFNPIGAHESGLLGEDPRGIPNNIFPYISQVAAGILPELAVFGDDYDTPDGTGVRDYIHVCDLAEGHLAALDWTLKQTGCEQVNLGTGHGTSVLELVAAFERATGRRVPYRIAPRRPGDIASGYAATDKAEQLLGWRAKRDIDDMCRDGWNFTKSRFDIK